MTAGAASYTVPQGGDVLVEHEIKRSRFLGYVRRVETEDEARAFVAELRRRHHDARHHCSAFLLGATRETQRSSDDGEPAGTAGVPMLEALLQHTGPGGRADLSDVCAVVVRYFGGIKLGAGGLVRAYSDAVSSALLAAPLTTRRLVRHWRLAVPHADAGRVESTLRGAGLALGTTAYTATSADLELLLPHSPSGEAAAAALVATATGGTAQLVPLGVGWADD